MAESRRARRKGRSLWGDAWRRLRRNRLAMFGLVVVGVISAVAAVAPWAMPFEPDYGQPWLRAQAPGFSHPAVLAELRFDRGRAVVVPPMVPRVVRETLTGSGTLVYTVHEIAREEYRVRLRRGRVERRGIQRTEGAVVVDRLAVSGPDEYLEVEREDGTLGPAVRDVELVPGEPLPEALASDARVLILQVAAPRTAEPETIRVELRDDVATELVRGGRLVDELRLEGRFVKRVERNGAQVSLYHWWGTDLQGRDVFSRVVHGGRISLMVGAVATIVSVLIGVVYGAVAGYLAQRPMGRWRFVGAVTGLVHALLLFLVIDNPAWALVAALAGPVLWMAGWGRAEALVRAPRWRRALDRPVTTTGEFMMRIVDILYALPYMFVVILLMISFGRDLIILFLALGAVQWLTMARIVRGQVLSLKEKEFVEAARMSGAGDLGILFRHLIPNTLGVVIVYATLTIPAVILQESFLAFIGLTVELGGRTLDSWGSLVDQGRKALTTDGGNWWVLLFPSLAMALTLFSLNFLGDGLRDALDPQLKGRG